MTSSAFPQKTCSGPYGFKNRFCFPLIHNYNHFTCLSTMKRDFKQELLKRFSLLKLLQEYLTAQGDAHFFLKILSMKTNTTPVR